MQQQQEKIRIYINAACPKCGFPELKAEMDFQHRQLKNFECSTAPRCNWKKRTDPRH